MDNGITIILEIACLLIGVVIGIIIRKWTEDYIGSIIIDPFNPEANGGIYNIFDQNPHEMVRSRRLRNGQRIVMDIIIADVHPKQSQENQGA